MYKWLNAGTRMWYNLSTGYEHDKEIFEIGKQLCENDLNLW